MRHALNQLPAKVLTWDSHDGSDLQMKVLLINGSSLYTKVASCSAFARFKLDVEGYGCDLRACKEFSGQDQDDQLQQ